MNIDSDFDPARWYWTVGGDTTRAWSSEVGAYVNDWPNDRVTRIASEEELSDVLRSHGLAVARPSSIDVTAEYRRRLFELLGADDLAHAGFIHADDQAEAAALRAIASPTDEQLTRLMELEDRAHAVATLIEKYNNVPEPPPADYRDNRYWT